MDTRKLIDMLTQNPAAGAAMGGLAGSVLGNVLTGRGGGKKLLKYGGLAAIGYVAYQAWQKNQAQKAGGVAAAPALPMAQALPAPFDLEAGANASNALRVIQAMIAASKADGVVDASERDRVFDKLREANLPQQDQDEVLRLLTQPMDMESVVRGVDSRELALEIYAASVFAVSPASRAERAYLDLLAARLGLDGDLSVQIEQGVEAMARR
ncbi:MAG: tellurite resistance TerB family protein [Steroidobacteraceae bacterium]